MKRLIVGAVTLALAATVVTAEDDITRIYTHPVIPPAEVLDRLNLQVAWRTVLPTDGRPDSLFTVEVMDDQILAESRSGMVTALNTRDGTAQWTNYVGIPYRSVVPLGYNAANVFVLGGTRLFALDRRTGVLFWQYRLSGGMSGPPTADARQVYLPMETGELVAYELPAGRLGPVPTPGATGEMASTQQGLRTGPGSRTGAERLTLTSVGPLASTEESSLGEVTGPQPSLAWRHRTGWGRLEQRPLLAVDLVTLVDSSGAFFSVSRDTGELVKHVEAETPQAVDRGRFGELAVGQVQTLKTPAMGQHGDIAYIASQDFNVYAYEMSSGQLLWRFRAGGPISEKPAVNDEDVYVTAAGVGLYRLSRDFRPGGQQLWFHARAHRFLAANRHFVYAATDNGRLLVLDRQRGTTLTELDIRDFVYPVVNEVTDRLFLAANDGTLVCLHDRLNPRPLRMKTVRRAAPPRPSPLPPPPQPRPETPPADK